jgi:hypothetical protein
VNVGFITDKLVEIPSVFDTKLILIEEIIQVKYQEFHVWKEASSHFKCSITTLCGSEISGYGSGITTFRGAEISAY